MRIRMILLLLVCFCSRDLAQNERLVLVTSGLNIRNMPNGSILATAPYGALIKIEGQTESPFSTSGFQGHWQPVSFGSVRGYAFDAFFSDIKVPSPDCNDLLEYVRSLGVLSSETSHILSRRDEKGIYKEVQKSASPFVKINPDNEMSLNREEVVSPSDLSIRRDVLNGLEMTTISSKHRSAQFLYLVTLACLPQDSRSFFADFSRLRARGEAPLQAGVKS